MTQPVNKYSNEITPFVLPQPNQVPPELGKAFQIIEAPIDAHVVEASNQPSGWQNLIVTYIICLSIPLLVFFLMWKIAEVDFAWAGLVSLTLTIIFFMFTLVVTNGDLPAIWEIFQSSRVSRRKIDALENIMVNWIDVEAKKEENRATEARLMIELQTKSHDFTASQVTLLESVRSLVDEMHAIRHELSTTSSTLRSPEVKERSFVPAKQQPALDAVQDYILTLFDTTTGKPKPEEMYEDGRLARRVPWSQKGDWTSKPWATEATNLLTQAHHSKPPLISELTDASGRRNGYAFNIKSYPDLRMILNWLNTWR